MYQQLLMNPNPIFIKDEGGENVSFGCYKKIKGNLEVDQGGMINGKWVRGRRRKGGWEEGEEDRKERRGGQQFGVSMLLEIHYY